MHMVYWQEATHLETGINQLDSRHDVLHAVVDVAVPAGLCGCQHLMQVLQNTQLPSRPVTTRVYVYYLQQGDALIPSVQVSAEPEMPPRTVTSYMLIMHSCAAFFSVTELMSALYTHPGSSIP